MIVFLHDRFVPAEEAKVSVFDRGFLYGDGLFETIRVYVGRPFLWPAHVARLERGAGILGIRLPLPPAELRAVALELLRRNALVDAILRVAVSRGPGRRGYSPRGADQPTLVLTAHAAPALGPEPPPPWRLHTSAHRVPAGDPLSAVKTASKLLNVIARAEAEDAGADEALLLNAAGRIAETAGTNIFWFTDRTVHTPGLAEGALAGVTRGFVLDLLPTLGWSMVETAAPPSALREAEGVFLTTSSVGLVEVVELDGLPLRRHGRIAELQASYRAGVLALLTD